MGVSSFAYRRSAYPLRKPSSACRQKRSRGEEACRSFRIQIEVLGTEAGRPRLVEVRAPRDLGDDVPERAIWIAGGFDVDVSIPDRLSTRKPVSHERKAVLPEAYPPVEQEHPLAVGRPDPRPSSFESTAVRLRDDLQGEPACKRTSSSLGTPVARAVVHENDLGDEAALLDCVDERVDRGAKVRRLVVNRHDDAERFAHARWASLRRVR